MAFKPGESVTHHKDVVCLFLACHLHIRSPLPTWVLLIPREHFAFVEPGPSKEFKVPFVSPSVSVLVSIWVSYAFYGIVIILSRDAVTFLTCFFPFLHHTDVKCFSLTASFHTLRHSIIESQNYSITSKIMSQCGAGSPLTSQASHHRPSYWRLPFLLFMG